MPSIRSIKRINCFKLWILQIKFQGKSISKQAIVLTSYDNYWSRGSDIDLLEEINYSRTPFPLRSTLTPDIYYVTFVCLFVFVLLHAKSVRGTFRKFSFSSRFGHSCIVVSVLIRRHYTCNTILPSSGLLYSID